MSNEAAMQKKTRYILLGVFIGVLATVSSATLIAMMLIDWNASPPLLPFIPIYPNSTNVVRTIEKETDPNVLGQSGVLLHQTTSFQSSDAPRTMLMFYQSYMRKYNCEQIAAQNDAANLQFTCTLPEGHDIVTSYYVNITITPTNQSSSSVTIQQINTATIGPL
jgi:uncharacterized SAM-binding protein YcdF (DUF218 family)